MWPTPVTPIRPPMEGPTTMSTTLTQVTVEEYEFWNDLISKSPFSVGEFMTAPMRVRNNKKIVMMVVSVEGRLLKYASSYLRADPRVVSTAVRNDGLALQHADLGSRNDREIVMDAIFQNPRALAYASGHLRMDPSFMRLANQIDSRCAQYGLSAVKNPVLSPFNLSDDRSPTSPSFSRSHSSVPSRSRSSMRGGFLSRVMWWKQH